MNLMLSADEVMKIQELIEVEIANNPSAILLELATKLSKQADRAPSVVYWWANLSPMIRDKLIEDGHFTEPYIALYQRGEYNQLPEPAQRRVRDWYRLHRQARLTDEWRKS